MLLIRHDDHLHISEGDDFCSKESNDEKWVTLNVGGKLFTTTSMALTAKEPFSMLARMFAADSGSCSSSPSCRDTSGAYLIDQSPTYFEPILNFLRHGKLILDEGVNPEVINKVLNETTARARQREQFNERSVSGFGRIDYDQVGVGVALLTRRFITRW